MPSLDKHTAPAEYLIESLDRNNRGDCSFVHTVDPEVGMSQFTIVPDWLYQYIRNHEDSCATNTNQRLQEIMQATRAAAKKGGLD